MLSTITLVAVFTGLLLGTLALWALFLRLGLRWAKVPDVTLWRVIGATVLVGIVQIGVDVVLLNFTPTSVAQTIFLAMMKCAAAVLVPCFVISAIFRTHIWRAFLAWLPTLLSSGASLAFALLVLRPYLYEAFSVPSNAMAPTFVGNHWQSTCPQCGQPRYCSPREERYATADSPLMICDNFHVTQASDIDTTVHSGDRFVVAKFLTPRRWDLVVFYSPRDPETPYVKRLIGFPGEEVRIQDGSVWIDGERQTPPESLRGIEYLSELPGWYGPDVWGSADHPALLGDDEFFVLGDFSAQSNDSRLWREGAPGHPAYAVPASYLIGVVTHTYWPAHRCRIHR